MSLRVVTPPTVEAVLLADAKQWLRVDHDFEDGIIQRLLYTALAIVENITWRSILPQTLELQMERFPSGRVIVLPYPRLTAVESIEYLPAGGGGWGSLEGSRYEVDTTSEPGRILIDSAGWPATEEALAAVKVTYTAGWDRTEIPLPVQNAIQLIVDNLYHNRSGMTEACERAVSSLLGSYSIHGYAELPYLLGTNRSLVLEGQ